MPSLKELRKLATKYKIKGRSKLNKQDLIRALAAHASAAALTLAMTPIKIHVKSRKRKTSRKVSRKRKTSRKVGRKRICKYDRNPVTGKCNKKPSSVVITPTSGFRLLSSIKKKNSLFGGSIKKQFIKALTDGGFHSLFNKGKKSNSLSFIPTIPLTTSTNPHQSIQLLTTYGVAFDKTKITKLITEGFGFFDYLDRKYGSNKNLTIPYDIKLDEVTLMPTTDLSKCRGTYIDLEEFVSFSDPSAAKDVFSTSSGQCFSKQFMFDYWNKTNLTADDNSSRRVTPSLPKDPFTGLLFPPTVLVELLASRPKNIIDPLQTLVNVVGDKKNGIYTTGPYLDLYKFEIIKKDAINFFNMLPNTEATIPYASIGQSVYSDVCRPIGYGSGYYINIDGLLENAHVLTKSTQNQILDKTGMRTEIMGSVIGNLKLLIRDSIIAYFLDIIYIQHLPDNHHLPRGLKKYTDVAPSSLDCTVFSSCFITSYLTASSRNKIYKRKSGSRYEDTEVRWDKPIPSDVKLYAYKRFSNLVMFNNFSMISSNLFFTANLGLPASTLRKSYIIANKTWATKNDVNSNTFLGYEWVDSDKNTPCDPVETKNITTSNPCRTCIRDIGTGGACGNSIDISPCKKSMEIFSSSIVQIR